MINKSNTSFPACEGKKSTSKDACVTYPDGIFSGFTDRLPAGENRLIALLRYKENDTIEHRLVYIDLSGNEVFTDEKKILSFLKQNIDKPRVVPTAIDECEREEIYKYSNALKKWLNNAISSESEKTDHALRSGSISLSSIGYDTVTVENKFKDKNWELICWEVISNG